MRAGFIVHNPIGTSLGYSIRPRELCRNLSILGCNVQVFSTTDETLKFSESLVVNGVPGWQTLLTRKLHNSGRDLIKNQLMARFFYRKRVFETLSNRLAASLFAKVKSCGIEVLQGETEIASMAAIILGKRLGIPVVADIHGLLVEEAIQYGFLKEGSKQCQQIKSFVSDVLHESDAVVVVSENLKSYLEKDFALDSSKIFCIPNAGKSRGAVRPSWPSSQNLVYAGIFEPWERVNLAIESMPYVLSAHEKARFLIAGDGSLKAHLAKIVINLKVSNSVTFAGIVPYDKIADFMVQSDIAVLPSTLDVVRKVACPIKLFDYLITGLPVVTVVGLWWSDFVRQNNVGLVAENNPKSFATAINDLLSNPDKINAMSEKAIKLVRDKHNWCERAKKLLEIYEKLQ